MIAKQCDNERAQSVCSDLQVYGVYVIYQKETY